MRTTSLAATASTTPLLPLVLAGFLVGCPSTEDDTGDSGDTADTGDTADSGDTADTGDTGAASITVSGTLQMWPSLNPLRHASVCWTLPGDRTYCDDTGNMGLYTIDVPAESEGLLLIESSTAVRSVWPLIWGDQGESDVMLALESNELHDSFYAETQVEDSPAYGTLAIQVVGADLAALAGAEVRLEPEGTWEGPFYLGSSGVVFDPKAVTTVEGMGVAYFLAVEPDAGPYTPVITIAGLQCDGPRFGAALPPTIPALAATTTNLVIVCD